MRFGVHLVAAGKMIEGEKIARVARRAERRSRCRDGRKAR